MFQKTVVTVLFGLGVLCANYSWGQEQIASLDDALQLARKSNENGKYKKVLQYTNEIIRKDPKNAKAYYIRGIAYYMQPEVQKALSDFQTSIELDPKDIELHRFLVDQYAKLKRYDDAVREVNVILSRNPNDSAAYYSKGYIFFEKGQLEHAEKACQKALELESKNIPARNMLICIYMNRKEFEKAITRLNVILEQDPKNVQALISRGKARLNTEQVGKSIDDFNQAIRLQPKTAGAYYHRALAYQAKQDFQKAILDCTRALELDPKLLEPRGLRAVLLNDAGNYREAISELDQIISSYPEKLKARVARARVHMNSGNYSKAKQDVEHVLAVNSRDLGCLRVKLVIEFETEDFDGAIRTANQILDIDPKQAKLYWVRASAYYSKGALEAALGDIKKGLALGTTKKLLPTWHSLHSRILCDLGRNEESIEESNKAIRLDPKTAKYYAERGITYTKMKQFEKALSDFNRTTKLSPLNLQAFEGRCVIWFEWKDKKKVYEETTAWLKASPQSSATWSWRGIAYCLQDDANSALDCFNTSIRLGTASGTTHLYRGRILHSRGDAQGALADCQKARELAPQLKAECKVLEEKIRLQLAKLPGTSR